MGTDDSRRLRFGVLGPLAAWRDGEPLRLGGWRQRALLATLLVNANELVSVERLVDVLFGDQRSDTAANALRVAISRLRRLLGVGDDDQVLRTLAGGYLASLDPDQLDATRFAQCLEQGRQLLAAGDPAGASAQLRRGLALWRGAPLADLPAVEYLQAEIRRLDELQLAAQVERIEADLELGCTDELVPELDALIAANPLQERLRGQLMRALYGAGRQTDALAVYRSISETLRSELGLEPGRALQVLERSILEHAPALDVPRHRLPAARIPAPATPFLGRARELADTLALLSRPETRLLTLTGTGGSGKTRLALRLAEACAREHRDGVGFAGFADVGDPELIAPTICTALGLSDQPGTTPAERLHDWLRERSMLLVLDNLEQLAHGTAQLGALLGHCPRLRLLVTSREPLHLAGEQQYEVPVLDCADAVELLAARTRAMSPHTMIDPELAGAICDRLDRLPLAIELAAPRLRVLSGRELLDRLEDRLPVLVGGPRDAPSRQRTLAATIAWSYDLLDAHEQAAFRRLAVFPSPFTSVAAARVTADPGAAAHIEALVDKSMLTVLAGTSGTRYGMLETLRDFALLRLAEAYEQDELRRAHLEWALESVEAAVASSRKRPRQEVLPVVQAEYRNLVGALATAAILPERLRLATGFARLFGAGVNLREVQGLLEEALEGADQLPATDRVPARLELSRALRRRGELEAAGIHLRTAAEHAAAAGEVVLAGEISVDRGLLAIKELDTDAAREFLDQAARLDAGLDRQLRAYRLVIEAQLQFVLGELERARELYEAGIREVRRNGPIGYLIGALAALAELAVDMNDLPMVERCGREVLAIADPVDDAYFRAGALLALGRAALLGGRPDEAARWLVEGARLDLKQGSMGAPEMLDALARAIADGGRARDAAVLLGAAAALRERLGYDLDEQEQRHTDAAIAAARTRLPQVEFVGALTEGRCLGERERLALIARVEHASRTGPQASLTRPGADGRLRAVSGLGSPAHLQEKRAQGAPAVNG